MTESQEPSTIVSKRYGQIARLLLETSNRASCCASGRTPSACCGSTGEENPITGNLYADSELAGIPIGALQASLGCGNPTALAELQPGQVVLDLGSGGGIDVLLSARRVGPNGFVYGLDMTEEMLELAERNRLAAGISNVRFLKGRIEQIPLPDESVDVIISNCVINLSGDKDRVLREAFRVLRSNGRLAVSDIVWRRAIPEAIRRSADLWAGCVAGALMEEEYKEKLAAAGFHNISITPTRVYTLQDLEEMVRPGLDTDPSILREDLDGAMISAFIRAEKPSE